MSPTCLNEHKKFQQRIGYCFRISSCLG